MDFDDTPEEAKFRAEVRTWLDENAPKHVLPYLDNTTSGKNEADEVDILDEARKWRKKKFDAGWTCLGWEKESGGRDLPPIMRVIWGQEEGVYSQLNGLFTIGEGMCGPTMSAYATAEQKKRYLPKLASGEEIWCQMFSEPAAGSDLAGLRMRSMKEGDEWIVNGQKIWTSGAHYSDYGLLITRSDPTVPKHMGLTMFFVDMKSPGIEIRPIKQANEDSAFNEVYFTDVKIPDSQRLGGVGDGWGVSLTTLMNERLSIGGSMSTGFDEMLSLVKSTKINGTPAVEDPATRQKMAEWHCRNNGLKYTSARLISAYSKGRTPGPEASIGKLVAGSMRQELSIAALDMQGTSGLVHDPERSDMAATFQAMLLRSPATRIEGGSDEILRNIIAERVLGLPSDIRVDKAVPFNDIPTGDA
jgi:acyl-CoA dehydrogenase